MKKKLKVGDLVEYKGVQYIFEHDGEKGIWLLELPGGKRLEYNPIIKEEILFVSRFRKLK